MKIVYLSNFINHHQVGIADSLYKKTGGEYRFVCSEPVPETMIRNGYPLFDRPYIIQAYTNDGFKVAMELACTSYVAIFDGSEDIQPFRDARLRRNLLSFECGERWLKKGLLNLLSPRLIKSQWRYHIHYYSAPYYALNMSAYGAADYKFMHSFIGMCYKWGYFTKVKDLNVAKKEFSANRLMWVNRFIDWKHPELPVLMARKLKDQGRKFTLDMYGSGIMTEKIRSTITKLGLTNVVFLRGNLPNDQLVKVMRNHDILLATSDRNEGWGASVNEGMSSGCVLIGSHLTGSVPFLIEDGKNGLVFKSGSVDSLCEKVLYVLDNPERCKDIAKQAYITMRDIWSPANAANCLLQLIEDIKAGRECSLNEGPCSVSPILK